MNVFDSIPDGFFNCLASSANHRAYAGCLNTIYEQYNSAVSYRLPRSDIRDSLTIYLLQNHIVCLLTACLYLTFYYSFFQVYLKQIDIHQQPDLT